jgi:hypothetical protein
VAKILAKLIGLIGGKKIIKKVLIDLLVKVLAKELNSKKLAKDIHDGVQDRGIQLLGAGYERLERDALEPFAAELLRLWKKD